MGETNKSFRVSKFQVNLIHNASSYERRLVYQEIGGLKNVCVSLVYNEKDMSAEKKMMRIELAFTVQYVPCMLANCLQTLMANFKGNAMAEVANEFRMSAPCTRPCLYAVTARWPGPRSVASCAM